MRLLKLLFLAFVVVFTVSTSPAVNAKEVTTLTILNQLTQLEEKPRSGYNREDFAHWLDSDNNGCSTREEILITESQTKETSCKKLKGPWYSIYDDKTLSDPRKLEIDHVVALAEAWDSGAATWSKAQKASFANDLSPYSLQAVTTTINRFKSDKDFGEYKPRTSKAKCFLANAVVITKWRWDLSVDKKEFDSLKTTLKSCPSQPLNGIVKFKDEPVSNTNQNLEIKTGIKPTGLTCPEQYPVKGNISSSKIYHLPNSPYYTKTIPELCFNNYLSAEKAGFRVGK